MSLQLLTIIFTTIVTMGLASPPENSVVILEEKGIENTA